MRKALVLGEDTRAFLSVVRSLGRGGVQVHAAWAKSGSPALHSRYIHKCHPLPEYDEAGDWLTALVDLMKVEHFDLVIPCSDETLIPLQRHRASLEPFGRIYLLDDESYRVLFDKIRTNELARSVGVRVPSETVVTCSAEARAVVGQFCLPVVLKPQSSFRAEALHSKQTVHKAYTWETYHVLIAQMLQNGPVAIQENFVGIGVGVELLLDKGRVLLAFQHERVHEPLHGGGSSYRRSVAVTSDLVDASTKILGALSYTGVAMVEFKVRPDTGEWVFIEVNARFWGSLPLALAAGANFPHALYQLLVEGKRDFPTTYRSDIYCRNIEKDLMWQIQNLRADRRDNTLATRPIGRVVRDAFVNTITLREHLDTLTRDDPGPGMREISEFMGMLASAVRRRVMRMALLSRPGRKWLHHKTRRALARANSILVVCKGNICRSPFAARLLDGATATKSIRSAGYYPVQGRGSPGEAVAAAAEWGVNLRDHRSAVLTSEMVHAADIVLLFDLDNYERLWSDFPLSRGKLYFVGALATGGPLFVSDPWGGDLECFRAVYGQIAKGLNI